MTKISKASFGGLYGTSGATFPDNTTAEISEGDMRTFGNHIQDSVMFIDDHFIDEDSFTSDSATKAPSQQSTKAYIASQLGTVGVSTTIAVSSAEILALNTTPKVLIAAPGAGKFIQVLYGYILLDFGGTAYTNETTEIEYATGQDIVGTITSFLNVGVDTIRNITATSSGTYAFSQVENSAVRYRATSADPTTGNGTISINLVYRIVTI